jgi:hypothetical protein
MATVGGIYIYIYTFMLILFYFNILVANIVTCAVVAIMWRFHLILQMVVSPNSNSQCSAERYTRHLWGSQSSCTMRCSWAGSLDTVFGTSRISPPLLQALHASFSFQIKLLPPFSFYKVWANMAQSSKSYFDYSFLLYYISYGYEFILIGKYIWLQI